MQEDGRWFDARFAGERIPTWEEAVRTIEMRYYLVELGVDAVFTDNPDRFPRGAARAN